MITGKLEASTLLPREYELVPSVIPGLEKGQGGAGGAPCLFFTFPSSFFYTSTTFRERIQLLSS